MQREHEQSRIMITKAPGEHNRTHPYLLRVTSVITAAVFSVFTLFSCHQEKIGNPTETTTRVSEKVDDNSTPTSTYDLPVRPISEKIVVFRGKPVAVAVQIIDSEKMRKGYHNNSPMRREPRIVTVTTSEGRRVRGLVRELVTGWNGVCNDPARGNGGDGGFPWTESDIFMTEGCGNIGSTDESRHQLFLVIEDGGDLASGLVRIGDKTISVDLENPPDLPPFDFDNENDDGLRDDADRYAHPDPVSPLDSFRRLVMSSNKLLQYGDGGITPAVVTLPEILSRQNADRLSYRLNRLRLVSPSAADTLMEVLMRKCRDGLTTFASWPVYPPDLADLDFLLSREENYAQPADWASSILAWVDRQPEIVGWVESSSGSHIRVALANLTGISQKREIAFVSERGPGEVKNIIIPAETVYRTQIARNYEINPGNSLNKITLDNKIGISETGEALEIRNRGTVEQRIALQPSRLKAVPPFVSLGPPLEMWRVQSWAGRVTRTTTPDRRTTAQLSFVNGRWRLRFDCRTPNTNDSVINRTPDRNTMKGNEPNPISKATHPRSGENDNKHRRGRDAITDLDELSGREAITIFIGPYSKPRCVMSVFPDGRLLIWDSDREINEKNMHDKLMMQTKRNNRSWSVALNLPDWWLEDDDSSVELGYVRTHEETRTGDCYPYPCLPWRLNPGRVRVDLSLWNP